MDYNNLTYRFLEKSDFDLFMELHDRFTTWMGEKKSPEQIEVYRKFRKDLFFSDRNKTVGAFDSNNNLVATTAGIFPPDFPHWFTHSQFHKLSNTSLSNGLDSWMVLTKMFDLLCFYAESNNYFSFYNQRSMKHAIAISKVRQLVEEKNLYTHRYNASWETVYPAGQTKTPYRNHKFYFHENAELNSHTDSVVILHTLKQEHRLEWFNKNKT